MSEEVHTPLTDVLDGVHNADVKELYKLVSIWLETMPSDAAYAMVIGALMGRIMMREGVRGRET